MRIIVLFFLLAAISCSKKAEEPPAEPEERPSYYEPTQSAKYDMKSLEYGVLYSGTFKVEIWRMLFDSAGINRTINGRQGSNNNAVLTFQHSDFVGSANVESPEFIYDAHWPAWEYGDWSMARKKENSFFMTDTKPNQIDLVFKNGVTLTFNIGAMAHIGITLHPPGAEGFRKDRSAAMDFMRNRFGLIQDSDSAKVGVQPKQWSVLITDR